MVQDIVADHNSSRPRVGGKGSGGEGRPLRHGTGPCRDARPGLGTCGGGVAPWKWAAKDTIGNMIGDRWWSEAAVRGGGRANVDEQPVVEGRRDTLWSSIKWHAGIQGGMENAISAQSRC